MAVSALVHCLFDFEGEITMPDWKTRQLILILSILIAGCGSYSQVNAPKGNVSQDPTQDKTNSSEKKLFEGENLVVIETDKSNLEQFPFKDVKGEFCFGAADEKVKKRLAEISSSGDARYFKIEPSKRVDFGTSKFTLKLTKIQAAKVRLEQFKEFDRSMSMTRDNEVYFIENDEVEYLATIGKDLAATGIGVNYWDYFVMSLNSQQKPLEFASLSSNPRTIKLGNVGIVYYLQIDDDNPSLIQGPTGKSASFRIKVSLFKFDSGVSSKKFEFHYSCQHFD